MLRNLPPIFISALVARIEEALTLGSVELRGTTDLFDRCCALLPQKQADATRLLLPKFQIWAQKHLQGPILSPKTIILAPHGEEFNSDAAYIEANCNAEIITKVIALAILTIHDDRSIKVVIHPQLLSGLFEEKGKRWGRAMLGSLAEMGLAGRPWHLYVGSDTIIERLSPYVRDLGEALWARHTEQHVDAANELPWDAPKNGAKLYTLAEDFLSESSNLRQEKIEAERACGIVSVNLGGLTMKVADFARVQPSLWDARLPSSNAWVHNADGTAPILVQVPAVLPGHDTRSLSAMIDRICQSIGGQAQSIVFGQGAYMREAAMLHGQATSLMESVGKWPLMGSTGYSGAELACVDVVPWHLDEDGEQDIWHGLHDETVYGPARPLARVGGGAQAWAKVLTLSHRGALNRRANLQFRLYNKKILGGEDALLIDCLKAMVTQKWAAAADEPEKDKKPSSSARRMRV